MLKNALCFLFIFVLIALAFWCLPPWQGARAAGRHASAVTAIPVKAVPVRVQDMPLTLRAVGTVVPMQSVLVKSRIDSQIMAVKFHDGDNVKKGDPLFVLDDRTLKSQMEQVKANIQRDKAQRQNLEQQYNRAEKLARQGYATGATLDDARAALAAQDAAVTADKAALDAIAVQLGYTVITAPISGRTGTINVTVGNTVKANDSQPLVTINQIRPVQVQSALPQASFDAIRAALQGGDVTVSAMRDGSGKAVTGTLRYIDNAIDQTTGTFVTRSVFGNEDESLWPGMLVNLSITLREDKNAITVPEVAIQHAPDGDFVFAVQDGKAVKQPVRVARIQNNIAIIASGLKAGEQVVTDGQMSLQDGSAVAVQ